MTYAYPEDELKPISCAPQTRNKDNPADIGLNDVLGNYSLTLIDSLSTLAILASEVNGITDKRKPLRDFQDGVKDLVNLYGDGTQQKPCGKRACGFDLNSKVQVFETNIRGVGGLLSAHLFAIGELPIRGYNPAWKAGKTPGIRWKNGLVYNEQLLHLAYDLAKRLLPAFSTTTDIPYPRVNLRTGIPFYQDTGEGFCRLDGTSSEPREITENCAAGAGSLVLEFSTLSRMTGDMRFEDLAKRAFWAIWNRRSSVGLLGNGIDAENGQWSVPALSGVGAGIDSIFEYSIKSSILLSGLPYNASVYETDAPDSFLQTWQQAHSAVKRHVYRTSQQEKHPYYGQVDFFTGAARYSWIDNLSAYYPGLLVLAGEVEEAIESHLLFTALWTRYGALPERWHATNSYIDPNFRHWAGRPEFIESTFHLYQATKDPYYLHVGEMTLRDIRRRCWTKCGWADLGDVTTGEQRDRMESFFLGETAKYLYLLFSGDHPLNKLDRPVVFTTEGHPLVIPDRFRLMDPMSDNARTIRDLDRVPGPPPASCPAPSPMLPLTASNTANRGDLFHAAALAQLHLVPINPVSASPLLQSSEDSPGISFADIRSPTNYTFYPWTLPQDLIPAGLSTPLASPITSTLTFPNLGASTPDADKGIIPLGALHKIVEGVLVNSLSNLRLNMIQEPKSLLLPDNDGVVLQEPIFGQEFRIHGIANLALGRDEKVLITDQALSGVSPSDPHFTRIKDLEMVDLVVDVPLLAEDTDGELPRELEVSDNGTLDAIWEEVDKLLSNLLSGAGGAQSVDSRPAVKSADATGNPAITRFTLAAVLPTGAGAAPLPALIDSNPISSTKAKGRLPYSSVFYLASTLCDHRLPTSVAKSYNVLVLLRGDCSFNEKLAKIPSFAPSAEALQLVVVVSVTDDDDEASPSRNAGLIRPLLDKPQLTPHGFERRHPLAMVMVDGSAETISHLKRVATAIGTFDERGKLAEARKASVGDGAGNKVHVGSGIGVKRRYWFESMGVPISNLLMV